MRSVEIDDLYRLQLVGDAQISPDGTRIAYVVQHLDRESDEYHSAIYLWEGGESRQYTAGPKDSAPRWSPDGRRLAFLSGREGRAQIYVMNAFGGEPMRVTDQKLGAGTPVWSPDSRQIAFAGAVSTSETPAESDKPPTVRITERAVFKMDGRGYIDDRRGHVFVVDIDSGSVPAGPVQLTHGDFNHDSPVWSPDGEFLALVADRDPNWDLRAADDIWVVPRAGGQLRRITDGHGVWQIPVFSPDGSRIACAGFAKPPDETSTYYPQLWSFSRGGGDGKNLLAGTDLAVGNSLGSDWNIAGEEVLVWREDGIYFLVTEHGQVRLYRMDNEPQPVTPLGRHVMDVSLARNTVACTISDTTRPAEIALVALDTGMVETVTSHNATVLSEAPAIAPEQIVFIGADNAEIDGWLLKPARWTEGQRYPLVVYIHGGPISAYGETFFHEFQVLAGEGFGVFYCNPHGSSSVSQPFQVSIMGAWGDLDYRDVMAGVDRVLQEPWVDPHRLGVAGGSYGGYLVNWIISHSDRFAAACTQRSICNMVSQGGTSDWAATRGERLLATPEGDPERLWAMSPLQYAAAVSTPTLIIHSERDDRCPIEQGEQWFMALKRQGVPVRFVRFPEESHGLSRTGTPSRRAERMKQIVGWFKTYL